MFLIVLITVAMFCLPELVNQDCGHVQTHLVMSLTHNTVMDGKKSLFLP